MKKTGLMGDKNTVKKIKRKRKFISKKTKKRRRIMKELKSQIKNIIIINVRKMCKIPSISRSYKLGTRSDLNNVLSRKLIWPEFEINQLSRKKALNVQQGGGETDRRGGA